MTDSIEYYEKNAALFFDGTVSVDMSPLYQRFLPLVPDSGSILDAGCGSGRDSRAFLDKGYCVTAFDASETLCVLASEQLSQTVECARFEEIEWQNEFDAVWACASLLHVPETELPMSLSKLIRALKRGGVMYCSFKLGEGEREQDGRFFTDMTEDRIRKLIHEISPDASVETWISEDQRKDRNENWLNVIVELSTL